MITTLLLSIVVTTAVMPGMVPVATSELSLLLLYVLTVNEPVCAVEDGFLIPLMVIVIVVGDINDDDELILDRVTLFYIVL